MGGGNPFAPLSVTYRDLGVTPVQVIERLTLRRFTAADADDLPPLDNDRGWCAYAERVFTLSDGEA